MGLLEAIDFGRGGCLGSPRWRPIWKPFEDRRDRARSLPAAYANGFAQHVSDLIDADVGARYYAFAFWTTAGWGRYSVQVARRIQRACQFASCDVFPTLNRRSLNRIPFSLSLAAIVLPARKQDGVFHVHGFLRVPLKALARGCTVFAIRSNGRTIQVSGPVAVERFVAHLREFCGRARTSLHVIHTDV